MEIESLADRSVLCEKLNMKLMSRPGSLELIERGVLEVESDLKDIIKSGEIIFRRVSSDETDNFESSPSMKILKHQEALDEATARRLSLAAQQQNQIQLFNQEQTLSKISEQDTQSHNRSENVNNKTLNNNTYANNQRSLVTGQVSRFKGLVFHNYCPASSKENQKIREQQQEKYIQLQDGRDSSKGTNYPSESMMTERISNKNKCPRCSQTPDKISSLNDLTVAQLKTECRLRNLPRSGNKSSLITTLTPFKEEILAIENSCNHVTSQSPFTSRSNNASKLNLNDRSISLPTEYYENMPQKPLNNIVTPLTFNVACIGGSISNLPFGSYPILLNENQTTDSQKLNATENFTIPKESSDISTQSTEGVNLPQNSELQHQLVLNSTSVCYSGTMENVSQIDTTQPINPLLFYRLPTLSGQDPAFIQTNGLEMIQLVQQELLRNIECQSQMSSDQEPEIIQTTLQHQRFVLINFLHQLIQKTTAFHLHPQLTNDQLKINNWINNCSQFENQNLSQECMDNGINTSSQSFLAYLNQQQCLNLSGTDHMFEQDGENDLLGLINEVVAEDERKTNDANIDKDSHRNNLPLQNEIKPPNSPMQIDGQHDSKSTTKSVCSESSRGGDMKRAAWLQKVSPRLYKATFSSVNNELAFSAFNFEFSGSSILSGCGSRTSSEGCGSINSSITDAQILSPGTEKVLFETIFQHTNSSSSTDNDIFSSTMNIEES